MNLRVLAASSIAFLSLAASAIGQPEYNVPDVEGTEAGRVMTSTGKYTEAPKSEHIIGLDVLTNKPCLMGIIASCRLQINTAPIQAEAASCSGQITSGGNPQQLWAAGASVNGGEIQNQSSSPLYIRSRTAAGTTNATLDQNSYLIAAGQTTQLTHVSSSAYSIIGGTTGQQFYCRTW